jgi:ParB family chromosome partitioning protein
MGLQNKVIDMGHARALLALDSPALQIKIFKEIVKSNLSVRKVEELVKKTSEGDTTNIDKRKGRAKDMSAEFDTLAKRLSKFFNTKVQLTCSTKGKGKISIPFNNEEELERIINMMDKIK